jgi:hypothetical protein
MTYLDDSAQARAAARRLHGLLVEVRAAPKDARNYMLFDRRDELKGLGIDDNQIASFDPSNDALDTHIASMAAVAHPPNGFIGAPTRRGGGASETQLALSGTLAGSRSDGVMTNCTYDTPVGQFTVQVNRPYAACPLTAPAHPRFGRR